MMQNNDVLKNLENQVMKFDVDLYFADTRE
jgi:hypothetical protein